MRLVEDPPHRQLLVLGYPDMACAADDVPSALGFEPVACEGLDSRIVDVVRGRGGSIPDLPEGRGWLLQDHGKDNSGAAAATLEGGLS
ncbi:hypothetical protein [Streptomyces sp. NPDC059893]|uniref:hypothetical protein n=1 Tax=Streptomyces sp. NPDC059893 TaxID=3346990 RepID=UPI00365F4806